VKDANLGVWYQLGMNREFSFGKKWFLCIEAEWGVVSSCDITSDATIYISGSSWNTWRTSHSNFETLYIMHNQIRIIHFNKFT
jgi:hypothetical protein